MGDIFASTSRVACIGEDGNCFETNPGLLYEAVSVTVCLTATGFLRRFIMVMVIVRRRPSV